jgi:hypothetical protein
VPPVAPTPGSWAVKAGSWDYKTQNACQGDAAHDSVGVYLSVKDTGVTKLFFNTMTLKSRTVMNFEPVPASDVAAAGCKP